MIAKCDNVQSVVGTDISSKMISRANHYKQQLTDSTIQNKLTFLQQTSRLPKVDLRSMIATKDLVLMSFVLGHIAPRQAGIEVMTLSISTLKPGGKFALAEFVYVDDSNEDNNGHHHNHSHSRHHHHHHHHHHDHNHDSETTTDGHEHHNADDNDKSHHGGHIAYSENEIRLIFQNIGLKPDEEDQFTKFSFEWHGRTIQSIMAIGTKI